MTDPAEFEFVDCHIHFWDHEQAGLEWAYLQEGFDHPRLRGMHRLNAPQFTEPELVEQAGGVNISKIVHVQSCNEERPGLESAWVQSMIDSDDSSRLSALIAKAEVAKSDIVDVLEANAKYPAFRGVRDMRSPWTIGTDEFTYGFDQIAELGCILEVLVPHTKYDDVCFLADRSPETTIVLGHAGLAEFRDDDYFAVWSEGLTKFADRENVVVKISALASGADPDWSAQSLDRWVSTCIETFGPERSMFSTNWPIDRMYGDYGTLISTYREIVSDLDRSAQHDVFAATAKRVYSLS